jgi:hypothetical protein
MTFLYGPREIAMVVQQPGTSGIADYGALAELSSMDMSTLRPNLDPVPSKITRQLNHWALRASSRSLNSAKKDINGVFVMGRLIE